ncbi:hypothetical protein SESBI_38058 [Sesbania bispinosa]|nr:hypothetical protein SESBI_38058 [Sesbania bispinosa]
MYIATHKRKDGSYVNDVAKTIGEQIEVVLIQNTVDESDVSPNDVVGRVFQPKHSGGCKEKYTVLESQLQGTLNALKAYMKEGKVSDELASFFISQPSDAGSEPESPLHARGSSGGNNLNSQNNI